MKQYVWGIVARSGVVLHAGGINTTREITRGILSVWKSHGFPNSSHARVTKLVPTIEIRRRVAK